MAERVVPQQKFGSDPQAVSFRRAYLTLSPGQFHMSGVRESRRAALRKAGGRAVQAHPLRTHPKRTADGIVGPVKTRRLRGRKRYLACCARCPSE
jgi:hypothetical protein